MCRAIRVGCDENEQNDNKIQMKDKSMRNNEKQEFDSFTADVLTTRRSGSSGDGSGWSSWFIVLVQLKKGAKDAESAEHEFPEKVPG